MKEADDLIISIGDPNLQQIGIDIAEITIDSILEDGILKEVPIIGTLASAIKIGSTVRDRLFLKKVHLFLTSLKNITPHAREKFINDHKESDLGENLLLIIDKLDHISKARLLGRAFRAYIEESISYSELNRLINGINRLNIVTLEKIPEYLESNVLTEELLSDLFQAGFLKFQPGGGGLGGGTASFRNNDLLKTLNEHCLKQS